MKALPNDLFFQWVEETLRESGSVRFRVKGVSMQPLLRNEKDEVSLESRRNEELKRGDIILFKYQGRHILHRIIRVEASRFVLKGDNAVNCEYCSFRDIVGVVSRIHRLRPDGSYKDISISSLRNRIWRFTSILPRFKALISMLLRRIFRHA